MSDKMPENIWAYLNNHGIKQWIGVNDLVGYTGNKTQYILKTTHDAQIAKLEKALESAEVEDGVYFKGKKVEPLKQKGDYATPMDCLGAITNKALSGNYSDDLKKYLSSEIATIHKALSEIKKAQEGG